MYNSARTRPVMSGKKINFNKSVVSVESYVPKP